MAVFEGRDGSKTAIVFGDERISYVEFDDRIARATTVLTELTSGDGRPIAVGLRNRPEFYELTHAAARLDIEVVPVSWRFMRDEVEHMVTDSEAALLIAEDGAPVAGTSLTLSAYREARVAAPARRRGTARPVTFRYYTSGTSGRPKAVERARVPSDVAIERARALCARFGIDGSDHVHLACGPLYHTAPCAYSHYALLFGQTVVLMERFDAEDSLRLIQDERVTWSHMVPINFVRILAVDDADRYDLSSLRRVLHAAAPCPVDVKRKIMGLFPPGVVWEYYGMTEGMATMITAEEWQRKPGSVGRAWPGQSVKVLDDEGNECTPHEVGIVYASGARFSYKGDAAKTEAAWRGDLFTVGDMGYLDDDGYLFLTDRAHDMIITGGANVYPAEVEAVLYQHPGVGDVTVIGIPDDGFGEAVHAIVEPRAPLDPEQLIAFARERLAHYKCPRSVE
ncbi:MAG: AMP-binding protein, partial [Actinomycetota bacterium]